MSGWRPEEGGGKEGKGGNGGEWWARCCFHSRHQCSDRATVTQTSLTSCVYVQNTSIFYTVRVGGCRGVER